MSKHFINLMQYLAIGILCGIVLVVFVNLILSFALWTMYPLQNMNIGQFRIGILLGLFVGISGFLMEPE